MAADVWWKETIDSDVVFVAENMRQADRDEIKAFGHDSPLEALTLSVNKTSQCFTLDSQDGPLLICGACPKFLMSDTGLPWLLGSDEALKHRKVFMTDASKLLEIWLEQYKILENYVHVKNHVSVRWLKRIGFKMDEPIRFPNTGEYFMRFHMER